ncbi:AraC family transcriptional regulator [Hyphomicrobium sulfonivorans]|nr:AraC family transcriptional regulator [Hyphomicrobium sulfonivorans]NSL73293.1 AraC family transcriptional regulator [Hyphomicrobium sulfonivorans]
MVQLACEYIDANLTNPISLTDLEFLTGLSRRSLQYGFRAAFDRTPMQWVAQRRLEAVRRQILEAPPGANLTMIAGEYFANLGEFARMYRRRYGELPSATLKQALAKRLRS